jgi:hypothetical protein
MVSSTMGIGVKDQVYSPPMPESLRRRISQGTVNADGAQLGRTREELKYSFDVEW